MQVAHLIHICVLVFDKSLAGFVSNQKINKRLVVMMAIVLFKFKNEHIRNGSCAVIYILILLRLSK